VISFFVMGMGIDGFNIMLRSTAAAAASADEGFTMICPCAGCEKSVNGG